MSCKQYFLTIDDIYTIQNFSHETVNFRLVEHGSVNIAAMIAKHSSGMKGGEGERE